jgi:hypothetical protein
MKFFTPELYVLGNSADPNEVDRAEAEWERALRRYRRHYRKIEQQLPKGLRDFHDQYCLHDADLFSPAWWTTPVGATNVVIVVQNTNTLVPDHLNTLMFLQYTLSGEPSIETPVASDVFYRGSPVWLYDELDVVEPGVFSHEIFVSDGRVIRLTFREFQIQVAKCVQPNRVQTNGVPMAASPIDGASSAPPKRLIQTQ